ncbi:ABC transporter ATP-binding protein [Bacillus thuringiensis]|jgi:putative ABC transport system ATP-binding protein|uniref:ABC transporter ATP-binding protein n=1 Tax=Bacillus TaxID=1386 RepID=UPI00047DB6AC|nr:MULTISPECIES: ABC transporter ATP-binding protein [Bacillus]OTX42224.1 macrolide ABC transporter ATP-binding protein [Bacillus thuringiensis serovar malayensis]OUB02581.1 macrolide ABC transporter ATP-binding protein [Bacillus thuringiensis serovar shandongiensis]MDM5258267.1 ABC transporter ATP-binding protein [Bacillus toyonensis]MEC2392921.1 ABC transporter ATP-binding protein [Bacillus toyonensis]PGL16720.1 ABC transporter ATP-binding protein [Bacillus thuringiensis]
MITLNNISKTYYQGKLAVPILHGISLTIQRGEFVSIMGPSGSGKSTLMNIIGCLDRPTEGKYILNDVNILTADESKLALIRNEYIGFVFQHFNLLPRLSAVENVELPLIYGGVKKSERRQRALETLSKVGLSDRVHHLPSELSGGQKQRVAIARSIANNPRFIMADEPTGALDTKSGEQVMDIFTKLNAEGTTIVMVTHEEEVAEYSSRRILLRDGKITEDRRCAV